MDLERRPSDPGARVHPVEGVVETDCLPAHVVTVPVGEGPAQHGESNDVRVLEGVGEGRPPVHSDQQGHVCLESRQRGGALEAVMGPPDA